MSTFKRLKDKVTPPNVSISLATDKAAFALDEAVEGTLNVQSHALPRDRG